MNKLAIVGGLVILSGCAAIGYAVTRTASGGMSEAQTAAMTGAVAKLDGDIRAARAAVQARASTLSRYPFVRAAIGTDAATVADQVRDVKGEALQFSLENGEVLELGRIVLATKAVEELMVQPAGAMRHDHGGAAGSYAELVGDQLVITEVATVVPTYRADQYRGFLGVTRPLALAPALKPLVDAGITGKLAVGYSSVPIGAMSPGATTRDEALASQPGVKLVVAESPPRAVLPLPVLVGGIGAVVIGLLLVLTSALHQRSAAAAAAS